MAAVISPATSLRFNPCSTLRFITGLPRKLSHHILFPPISRRHSSYYFRRSFCSAVPAGEAAEKTKPDVSKDWKVTRGEKVGEFRKKLRISEIKGGRDEGLDRLGQTFVVKGWVRTLRVQSSVTFMEVRWTNSWRETILESEKFWIASSVYSRLLNFSNHMYSGGEFWMKLKDKIALIMWSWFDIFGLV